MTARQIGRVGWEWLRWPSAYWNVRFSREPHRFCVKFDLGKRTFDVWWSR